MSNPSMRHGGIEFLQACCNLVNRVVRAVVLMLAALGIYFLATTYDYIDELRMVVKEQAKYEYGG